MMLNTEQCALLAKTAHKGQRYGNKSYYDGHLSRVVEELGPKVDERTKQIAWLHDIVEDTDVTPRDLYRLGVDSYVVQCVECLTKGKNRSYAEYIESLMAAPWRVGLVKIADLRVNLAMTKKTIDEAPTGSWRSWQAKNRQQKYELALLVFKLCRPHVEKVFTRD